MNKIPQGRLFDLAYEKVLQEGLCLYPDDTSEEDERREFFVSLALHCHDLGVSEANAVRFTTMFHWAHTEEL